MTECFCFGIPWQVTSGGVLKGDFSTQIPALVCDRFARKVFLYLLAPGNKQYFSQSGAGLAPDEI